MDTWDFDDSRFKQYPHFDAPIAVRNVLKLVRDPAKIARTSFYPFLRYYDEWQPFRQKVDGKKPEKKSRPISYAARRDAYIYMYYRHILSMKYEQKLLDLGIDDTPIAYRKIKKADGSSAGKCNIDFAKDAFEIIEELGNCFVIALDIKGYFDHLDHDTIESVWNELIGTAVLPADHKRVFQSITKYSYVERKPAYERLGFYGKKTVGNIQTEGFLIPYKEMPKRLCSPQDFREKICGKGGKHKTLVKKNRKSYGIPQGSPISDLIANFYLIHFDKLLSDYAMKMGGIYRRYSDDILLVLPVDEAKADQAEAYAQKRFASLVGNWKLRRPRLQLFNIQSVATALVFVTYVANKARTA